MKDVRMSLTPQERTLVAQVQFDEAVLELVKEAYQGEIYRLNLPSSAGGDAARSMAGVFLRVPKENSRQLVLALRPQLVPQGYMPFLVATSLSPIDRVKVLGVPLDRAWEKRDEEIVGILRLQDPFDIIRVQNTNAANYDMGTEEIISRLKAWEGVCAFEVVGAGFDWVDLELKRLPDDIPAFAEDVYEFCPDIIDQGYVGPALQEDAEWEDVEEAFETQTVADLACYIRETHRLFLWWD
jgi:hypothetical protein